MELTRTIATSLLVGLLAACQGSPEDAPDYEVDLTSGGGSRSGAGEDTSASDGTSSEAPSTPPGGGTSAETGNGPSLPPTKVMVKVDGVTLTVGEVKLWSEVAKPGKYDTFISVTGAGVAAGSDIVISADSATTGCVVGEEHITYRPKSEPQYMPMTSGDPACGLSIKSLPKSVGERFTGTFKGTLRAINTTPTQTKNVEVTFDVLREK